MDYSNAISKQVEYIYKTGFRGKSILDIKDAFESIESGEQQVLEKISNISTSLCNNLEARTTLDTDNDDRSLDEETKKLVEKLSCCLKDASLHNTPHLCKVFEWLSDLAITTLQLDEQMFFRIIHICACLVKFLPVTADTCSKVERVVVLLCKGICYGLELLLAEINECNSLLDHHKSLISCNGFLLRSVILLCRTFGCSFSGCLDSVLRLLLGLYGSTPTRLPPDLSAFITSVLRNGTLPLLMTLMKNQHFATCATKVDRELPEMLVCLADIAGSLVKMDEEYKSLWTKSGLMDAIMHHLTLNKARLLKEYSNANMVLDDESITDVNLYNHVQIQVTRFYASLSGPPFEKDKQDLLKYLNSFDFWVSQLAMDVMLCIGRISSNESRYNQCQTLARCAMNLKNEECHPVLVVLSGLIQLLPDDLLHMFVKQYPPSRFYEVWSSLSEVPDCLKKPLVQMFSSSIERILQNDGDCIVSDSQLCSCAWGAYRTFTEEAASSLCCSTHAFWRKVQSNWTKELSAFCMLTSRLVAYFEPSHLSEVMHLICNVIHKASSKVDIYATCILDSFSSVKLHPDYQEETLNAIAKLSVKLLRNPDPNVCGVVTHVFQKLASKDEYQLVAHITPQAVPHISTHL